MRDTSWVAKGKLRPLWERLDGPAPRDQFAARVGIAATDLSSINSGRRPLTPEMADRIIAAFPMVTLLDLGAPEELARERPEERLILDRLEEVEKALKHLQADRRELGVELLDRIEALERRSRARTPRDSQSAS